MRRDILIGEIFLELKSCNLLPAIIFRTSRNQCDVDVEKATRFKRIHLSPSKQREILVAIDEIIEKYELDIELIKTHPHYKSLLLTGIGAHHAGQLLMWRLLLEELMTRGMLRILLATGTVAAGVDFPARTVVITAHSKRGSDGFNTLTASEFQQMSGRAGRRGKDSVGFCLAAPTPFCDARAILKISSKKAEPLKSAYFPSPSTVLNLLRYRNVDDLRYTIERSLASFKDKKEAEYVRQQIERDSEKLKSQNINIEAKEDGAELTKEQKKVIKRINRNKRLSKELEEKQRSMLETTLRGLTELGFVDKENLSEKGYWSANLCTSVVLELAEVIDSNLFDSASPEKIAAIVASISADNYRTYLEGEESLISDKEFNKLEDIVEKVTSLDIPGVSSERAVQLSAAYTAVLWMKTKSWQELRGLLFLNGVSEGDVARLLSQTAEHLNQITRLNESHPDLVLKAEEAKRRILRPPLTETILDA